MESSFQEWWKADLAWTSQHGDEIGLAFRMFMEDGEWPTIEDMQRFLFRSSVQSIDVQRVADSQPVIPGQWAIARRERFVLGARHLRDLPAARPLLELLVEATAEAVEAYRGPAETPSVQYDNPRFFRFDSQTVIRMATFTLTDHPDAFAGGGLGERWNLFVDAALVREFVGVTTPEEYVARQLRIIHRWADELDAHAVPLPTILKAFVVMPFTESWSDDVFAFVRSAVDRLEGRIVAVRADQITRLGRITDQIIQAISTSDLIIADITDRNANVFWELGFAHALNKPCALLMRSGEEAPFDIYDHRRLDYSESPTSDEVDRLVAILQTVIADAEGEN